MKPPGGGETPIPMLRGEWRTGFVSTLYCSQDDLGLRTTWPRGLRGGEAPAGPSLVNNNDLQAWCFGRTPGLRHEGALAALTIRPTRLSPETKRPPGVAMLCFHVLHWRRMGCLATVRRSVPCANHCGVFSYTFWSAGKLSAVKSILVKRYAFPTGARHGRQLAVAGVREPITASCSTFGSEHAEAHHDQSDPPRARRRRMPAPSGRDDRGRCRNADLEFRRTRDFKVVFFASARSVPPAP